MSTIAAYSFLVVSTWSKAYLQHCNTSRLKEMLFCRAVSLSCCKSGLVNRMVRAMFRRQKSFLILNMLPSPCVMMILVMDIFHFIFQKNRFAIASGQICAEIYRLYQHQLLKYRLRTDRLVPFVCAEVSKDCCPHLSQSVR